jgi:hypothetical protein
MARWQNANKQKQDGDGKSPAQLISHAGKIAEKQPQCLAAIRRQKVRRFTSQ